MREEGRGKGERGRGGEGERREGGREEGGRGREGEGETHTLSLGLSVLRMMSAASKSRLVWSTGLFFITITTSFGLGVADALYHGLRGRWVEPTFTEHTKINRYEGRKAMVVSW